MIRYDIDQTCDFCSMSKARNGDFVEYEAVEEGIKAVIEHFWSAMPSIDLKDKAKIEHEIRACFE